MSERFPQAMSQPSNPAAGFFGRHQREFSRRRLLSAGAAVFGSAALAACGAQTSAPPQTTIGPSDPAIDVAEKARRAAGARVVPFKLTAAAASVDLGGITVPTWAYGGSVPGRELRATAGDVLNVQVRNQLPDPTTVHWHGLALRNDMDGVPDVTQKAIPAGSSKTYEFVAPHPGTYWFHSHVGTQLDRGLYSPLIIEDPTEPGGYDSEHTIVLDDWLDGTERTPPQVLADLQAGKMKMGSTSGTSGMSGMTGMSGGVPSGMAGMGSSTGGGSTLGGDPGDVSYPYYLVNGRVAAEPVTIAAKPGQRLRLRLINAAADTAFRVALAGHRMTVTHTDGFPVVPVDTDALLISMGERYDVAVTLHDGVFALVAAAEGKSGSGRALIRTASGSAPAVSLRLPELSRRVLTVAQLTAAASVRLPLHTPDRSLDMVLGGGMMPYQWTINGQTYKNHVPLPIHMSENVQIAIKNTTTMFHPIHIHGHTFQVRRGSVAGPRKDTVIVLPGTTMTVDLVADNPGQWLAHCHNVYHGEAGMMTVLSYQR